MSVSSDVPKCSISTLSSGGTKIPCHFIIFTLRKKANFLQGSDQILV